MPLSKTDVFKSVFGFYAASQYDEWLAMAQAAVAEVRRDLAALKDKIPTHDVTAFEQALANYERDLAAAVQLKDSGNTGGACKALNKLKGKALGKARQIRAALRDNISADNVASLLTLDGGQAMVDQMVHDLNGKAGSAAKRDFVAAALKARFGIDTLEGDLTSKALPRLYKVFEMVPASHTTTNDNLKKVKRDRSSKEGASWYDESSDEIVINLGRTGAIRGAFQFEFYQPDQDARIKNRKVDSFDVTTLHEIGHAVDAQLGYMDSKVNNNTYGGWKAETSASVKEVAAGALGFRARFKDNHPQSYLDLVLSQALQGHKLDGTNATLSAEWSKETGRAAAVRAMSRDDFTSDAGVQEAERRRVASGGGGLGDLGGQAPQNRARQLIPQEDKFNNKGDLMMAVITRILRDGDALNAAVHSAHSTFKDQNPPMSEAELLDADSIKEADRLRTANGGAYGDEWNQVPQIIVERMVELTGPAMNIAKEIVKAVLIDGQTPAAAADAAMQPYTDLTAVSADPDLSNMRKHAGITFLKNVKMASKHKGLWDAGDAGADKTLVGGRTYHESYSGNYVSYSRATRSNKVSSYQYRAAGEWFAELYAMYYIGMLKDSHPAHAWLQSDIDQ